jgi:hypothetical protein
MVLGSKARRGICEQDTLKSTARVRPLKKKLVIVLFILQIRWGGRLFFYFLFFILELNIQNLARMSKDRNSCHRACAISTSIMTDREKAVVMHLIYPLGLFENTKGTRIFPGHPILAEVGTTGPHWRPTAVIRMSLYERTWKKNRHQRLRHKIRNVTCTHFPQHFLCEACMHFFMAAF